MKNIKKLSVCMSILILMLLTTACGTNYERKYQEYVKSLIAINYLGVSEDYLKSTGANKEDADALYQSNMELLADNILNYYGITITDAPELRDEYIELAKNVYSRVNYNVAPAYKDGSVYLVDITISPINLLAQSANDVANYVNKFNEAVAGGTYNDYTLDEYEREFSGGLLEILNEQSLNMTYADPVTVTVEIVTDDDTYYISERDFLRIDAAMINSTDVEIELPEEETEEE